MVWHPRTGGTAQRSGILHFLTQQQDVIQTQIFLDPNLATESKPGRCMSPLDWTRVPRKTHGTLCTTAGEARSFSAASETSLSSGRIQGGQVAPTRGIPPHHLAHPLYPLCPCRLETPLPHKEIPCHRQKKIHQNNCSFEPETSCLVPTQTHHGCLERRVAETLSQPAHTLRSAFFPNLAGRFCHSKCLAQKSSCWLQAWDLPPPRNTQGLGLGNIFCLRRHYQQGQEHQTNHKDQNNTADALKVKLSLRPQPQNVSKDLCTKPNLEKVTSFSSGRFIQIAGLVCLFLT